MTEPGAHPVRVTARAARDLDRLPEKVAAACVEFVLGPLAATPTRIGKPLTGRLAGLLSARRGAYRVVHRLRDSTVEILHIDHRSDVYR